MTPAWSSPIAAISDQGHHGEAPATVDLIKAVLELEKTLEAKTEAAKEYMRLRGELKAAVAACSAAERRVATLWTPEAAAALRSARAEVAERSAASAAAQHAAILAELAYDAAAADCGKLAGDEDDDTSGMAETVLMDEEELLESARHAEGWEVELQFYDGALHFPRGWLPHEALLNGATAMGVGPFLYGGGVEFQVQLVAQPAVQPTAPPEASSCSAAVQPAPQPGNAAAASVDDAREGSWLSQAAAVETGHPEYDMINQLNEVSALRHVVVDGELARGVAVQSEEQPPCCHGRYRRPSPLALCVTLVFALRVNERRLC